MSGQMAPVALIIAGFFLFFRYSKLGVAMRATAVDLEAALAQGISARRVVSLSWAIAGLVAALAGVTLAGGGGGVRPDIELVALTAFPAIILGRRRGRRRDRHRPRAVAHRWIPAAVRVVARPGLRPRDALHRDGHRAHDPSLRPVRPSPREEGVT